MFLRSVDVFSAGINTYFGLASFPVSPPRAGEEPRNEAGCFCSSGYSKHVPVLLPW